MISSVGFCGFTLRYPPSNDQVLYNSSNLHDKLCDILFHSHTSHIQTVPTLTVRVAKRNNKKENRNGFSIYLEKIHEYNEQEYNEQKKQKDSQNVSFWCAVCTARM